MALGRIVEAPPDGRVLVASGRDPAHAGLRIVDPERRMPLPDGSVGEIWLRGPHVARGYWSTPEDAADTFDATLAGAANDAANHYPQDLEETVAASHPGFAADGGAAFTIEAGGEEQVVIVHEITRPAAKVLAAETPAAEGYDVRALLAAAVRDVAGRHGLALYDLVLLGPRSLPRTSSGKVQRRRCRAAYLHGTLPRAADMPWPGLGRYRPHAAKDPVVADR